MLYILFLLVLGTINLLFALEVFGPNDLVWLSGLAAGLCFATAFREFLRFIDRE